MTKWNEHIPEQMLEYFKKNATQDIREHVDKQGNMHKKKYSNTCPTFAGFCRHVGISKETIAEWVKQHIEFKKSYDLCKLIQEQFLIENGLEDLYSPDFTKFMLKNHHGYVDKTEQEIKQDNSSNIEIVVSENK